MPSKRSTRTSASRTSPIVDVRTRGPEAGLRHCARGTSFGRAIDADARRACRCRFLQSPSACRFPSVLRATPRGSARLRRGALRSRRSCTSPQGASAEATRGAALASVRTRVRLRSSVILLGKVRRIPARRRVRRSLLLLPGRLIEPPPQVNTHSPSFDGFSTPASLTGSKSTSLPPPASLISSVQSSKWMRSSGPITARP